ncbi:hypothetical protein D1224_02075 [Henriciella barbarensis]|uniref:Uncharacterized protein n=1 Tax=Henriciella barbarensis TaxID=86342 RepID=A0A399R349_9PROT|nr:hypothetical protein [Henriciella barbarensis]RIJ25926.1 hypothetical protein D1224_02075 [Henriciella barbarensis]
MRLAPLFFLVLVTAASLFATDAAAEVIDMKAPEISAGFDSPVEFPECSLFMNDTDSVEPFGGSDLVFVCDDERGWIKLNDQVVELVEITRKVEGHDQTRRFSDFEGRFEFELVMSTAGQTDAFMVIDETQAMPPENRRNARICYASLRTIEPVKSARMNLEGILLSGESDE